MTAKRRGRKWPSPIERFEAKIRIEGECWIWTGSKAGPGYGAFRWKDQQGYAHRFAYEHYIGPIPDGLRVMHSCDTPACVNPAHLSVGTQAENLADMYAKGRNYHARGSASGKSVINEQQALAIYHDPRPQMTIAREYGIGQTTVCDIKKGRCWSHVTGHKAA